MPATPRFRLAAAAVAAAALFTVATGCASGDSDGGSAGGEQYVLKVTDPGNAGPLAVGKRDGTFDEALAPLGAKIEWVNSTPGFSSNLKLFNTGQLDVSGGAYSPVVGALSKNVGVKIIAVADPAGKDQNGILVTKDSGVTDVAGPRRQAGRGQPGGQG